MNDTLFERLVIALESIAASMERANPPQGEIPESEFPQVFHRGDEQEIPEDKAGYFALEERAGRFETLIKAAKRTR